MLCGQWPKCGQSAANGRKPKWPKCGQSAAISPPPLIGGRKWPHGRTANGGTDLAARTGRTTEGDLAADFRGGLHEPNEDR